MKEAVLFKFSWPRNDPGKVRVWRGGGGGWCLEGVLPSFYYSQTSPQWPLWGQKKVADVERWPLW